MRQLPIPDDWGVVSDQITLVEELREEAPDRLIGQKVGTIRIHRLVGEGGMGAVYAGFDERLHREVALKAVRADSLTSNGRARLLGEARLLSRLNHPNICAIYDFVSGEETDFLVLELIRGTTLREAIGQGILTADRADIAERIAEALGAAHAQGIIHRDLKSSNVMLTREGRVKVLDFGIARLGEDAPGAPAAPDLTEPLAVPGHPDLTSRTAPGKVIGTAGCMSPEQARGDVVTVASDMYSFGLLLQELFTGKLPYASTLNGPELLREVQRGRTLPVTGVDRHLAELIEQLKSSAPEDRPTAAEVFHRLRWIREKPRRRARALAAALALLLTAAGAVKYTFDLRRERDAAVQARQEAEIARRQADEVVSFLQGIFKVSDPGESRGSTVTARELLDQGARRARQDLRSQPAVQARMLDAIGKVDYKLGLYKEARPLLEEALRLRQEHPGDPLDLATSLEDLALVDWSEGRPQAEPRLRQALRLREARLGRRHPEVAKLLCELGTVYGKRGEFAKAEGFFREALEIREATLGPDHPDVAVSLNNLAMARQAQGDLRASEPLLRRGLAIRERALPPDHPDIAMNLEALALLCQDQKRLLESEKLHRRALAIFEKVLGPSHHSTTLVLTNLGQTLALLGRRLEAETLLRRAIAARTASLGPNHPDLADTLTDLADLYLDQKRYAEAEPLYRRALAILDAAYPPGHPTRRAALKSYARLLRATGRPELAREMEAKLGS